MSDAAPPDADQPSRPPPSRPPPSRPPPSPLPPSPLPGFYKVPRRFDLATVFAVTFAYAAFLGVMNAAGVPGMITGFIIGGLTLVGMIQMLVSPKMARFAAIACGWFAFAVAYGFVRTPSGYVAEWGSIVCSTLILGGLVGYCAGTVVAGVFLVADYLRRALRWILS